MIEARIDKTKEQIQETKDALSDPDITDHQRIRNKIFKTIRRRAKCYERTKRHFERMF